MAETTSSQQRAQLIREMSKDMTRSRNSTGSSRHSQGIASPEPTTSDFDPENEAIQSTRHLDNHSHQLPELRSSVRKYSRFTPSAEPDFAINTSAIDRAFPNFSQGGTSSEDDSMSIEIGRGARNGSHGTIAKLGRSREFSSNAQLSHEGDSMDFSAPMIGNYEVTTTPPIRQRQASMHIEDGKRRSPRRDTQARKPSGLQKETFDPSPPPAKTRDYGSGESMKSSGKGRQTLASLHARVRDEDGQSRLDDERPATLDLTARNTRFSSTKSRQPSSQGALPTRFSSAQTLLEQAAPVNKHKAHVAATPNQGTQQSFMLPDLPNISELVSGVFEDGTPVFSRHGKSRASRFVSSQQTRGNGFAGVHEIPVPDDEQAIFLSLKLLQDKVATLEKSNAEAASTVDELQQRNRELESEKNNVRRVTRSDSALGTTDSDGGRDTGEGQRRLLIEKNRLESSARALKREVDVGKRKYSTAETILKKITQERDSAIAQLGVAFVTIEQLKAENESLKFENNDLKSRFGQSGKQHEVETQNQSAQQASSRGEYGRKTEPIKNRTEGAGEQGSGLQKSDPSPSGRAKGHRFTEGRDGEKLASRDADTMFDLSSRHDTNDVRAEKERVNVHPDHSQDSEDSPEEPPKTKGKVSEKPNRQVQTVRNETSQDLTYLSFLDSREIAQLRRTLEQERIERKQRRNANAETSKTNPTITETDVVQKQPQSACQVPPRKSSMKDLTARSIKHKESTEPTVPPNEQTEHIRRHSENPVLSMSSRRRRLETDNMTSAFIVPDITIRNPGITGQHAPKLTDGAQEILDNLANHGGKGCTVCKRAFNPDENHEHGPTTNDTVKITRPIPVSERRPQTTEEEGDPTIRPAQAPGLALATVLKELEDELAHMKIRLSQYQTLYNGHDPALSKRRRKSVQQQIENILRAIDVKADQIYALYDVLEGQKQDGHEISEEEVEITLQYIGVKAPELHLRGGGDDRQSEASEEEKPTERRPWDLESDGDSSEGLPWEGIESTVETTRSGFSRAARRRGSRA